MATSSTPKRQRFSIVQYRNAIDSLNWTRSDLSGSTSAEFLRANVPERFRAHIARVEEIRPDISDKKIQDHSMAVNALERARQMIERWTRLQAEASARESQT